MATPVVTDSARLVFISELLDGQARSSQRVRVTGKLRAFDATRDLALLADGEDRCLLVDTRLLGAFEGIVGSLVQFAGELDADVDSYVIPDKWRRLIDKHRQQQHGTNDNLDQSGIAPVLCATLVRRVDGLDLRTYETAITAVRQSGRS
ncbi:hypothetical protein GQ42DRAFT_160239 [Ramicandelaber brevisporus]|nr:hypothetical protein GQ42DRAFT_160239 [Ramicandelaber brevisporus]